MTRKQNHQKLKVVCKNKITLIVIVSMNFSNLIPEVLEIIFYYTEQSLLIKCRVNCNMIN